jgi:hypothetical protein
MGSKLCNCSFLNNDKEKEENIAQIQNQELAILSKSNLKGKLPYFYINSSKFEFIPNSQLYNNPLMKIKQIYILNRLKFLSRKIRQFLFKKRTELTFGTITTANNEETYRYTMLSTNRPNYVNTDTGEIAYNNLALVKNQNIKKRDIKNYFKEEGYSERDGILNLSFEDDTKLEGIYYNNALNGFTRIYFSNKEVFKGELFNDEARGYGIYYFPRQGCEYEGYWNNNYKDGIGRENWYFHDNYEGEFKNGKKNGIGIYHWKDGSSYEGEWLNNNIHGWGIFITKDDGIFNCKDKKNATSRIKRIFWGHFIMNEMNGYGEMAHIKNNGFYYGYWKDNKKNGFGVEYSPRKNGEDKIYAGFWKNNERYGYGILFHKINEEKNIIALWKKNKVIKSFRNEDEFFINMKQNGFDNYNFFFKRTFDEHIKIINNLKNDNEEDDE